jgi:uncharacterized protein (DUF58 family)
MQASRVPSAEIRAPSAESQVLEAVRTFRWPARRPPRVGSAGGHLARTLGTSVEFSQYRAYRQGDDTRRLDWKLLARSDRAYIRLSNDRAVVPTLFLLDATASLAYPLQDMGKWRYARQLALGLATCALSGGDPVGLMIASMAGTRRLPARSRSTVINELTQLMDSVHPAGTVRLAPLLGASGSHARTVIISDFLGDAEELIRAAGGIVAGGREVYALHVLHPNELDPPTTAAILTDPEDETLRRPVTPATSRQYREAFGAWRSAIAQGWRGVGATYHAIVTSEPVVRAIRRVVMPAVA